MHPWHTCPACAAAGVVGCLQVRRAPVFQRSLHSSLQLPCPALLSRYSNWWATCKRTSLLRTSGCWASFIWTSG